MEASTKRRKSDLNGAHSSQSPKKVVEVDIERPASRKSALIENILIAIACLTLFPLIYLIGRAIMIWLE